MKIALTGATGLIGTKLYFKLGGQGHELTVISRDSENAEKVLPGASEYLTWNYRQANLRSDSLEGMDAVIHLAGSNIFGKRWSEDYKKEIFESRIISTKILVETMSGLKEKPECFISSSAVGYYGDSGNELLNESASSGSDFLAYVCKEWEKEARKADSSGIRTVNIRTGIVLDKNGGALARMMVPFKMFVGGPIGSGKQWFPWIHIDDLVNTYLFALKNDSIKEAVNAVSPNPVTMNGFAKALGQALHRPSVFKVPAPVLRIVLGESSESVLASIRAVPAKLSEHQFKFRFEELNSALKDLIK